MIIDKIFNNEKVRKKAHNYNDYFINEVNKSAVINVITAFIIFDRIYLLMLNLVLVSTLAVCA